MKRLLPLLLLSVPLALGAAAFEGRVTMKLAGPRGTPPLMTFSLKEGFSRIDLSAEGQAAAMIFNAAKQEMTMLMPEQRMFMTQPMAKASTAAAAAAGGAADTAVEVTATKEKILGYDCVKYLAKTRDGTTEIWVTDQLGAFPGFGGGGPMGGMGGGHGGPEGAMPPQAWEQALLGKGVFPLRVVSTTGRKETFRMEATAVDKIALPASTFAPPADFQDIGAMMRGIPGMPPGMKLPGTR